MGRWWALAVLAACGPAHPNAPTVDNHALATPAAKQHLGVLVIEEISGCTLPHHLAISIDGIEREVVEVPGPPIDVEPGEHRLGVRDAETGLVDEQSGTFPLYGFFGAEQDPKKNLPVDVITIAVHVDWIQINAAVRANLMML